jgi:hypothetical protein
MVDKERPGDAAELSRRAILKALGDVAADMAVAPVAAVHAGKPKVSGQEHNGLTDPLCFFGDRHRQGDQRERTIVRRSNERTNNPYSADHRPMGSSGVPPRSSPPVDLPSISDRIRAAAFGSLLMRAAFAGSSLQPDEYREPATSCPMALLISH